MSNEAFIPPAPATPEPKVTIQGFGTGTVTEIEYHLARLKDELEGTRRDLEAAQRELEHRPATVTGMIADMIDTRIEKALAQRDLDADRLAGDVRARCPVGRQGRKRRPRAGFIRGPVL